MVTPGCSEDGRVRRPGPGWQRRALHLGVGGGSHRCPGPAFIYRDGVSVHVPCVYVSGTPVRASSEKAMGSHVCLEQAHMMSPAGSR